MRLLPWSLTHLRRNNPHFKQCPTHRNMKRCTSKKMLQRLMFWGDADLGFLWNQRWRTPSKWHIYLVYHVQHGGCLCGEKTHLLYWQAWLNRTQNPQECSCTSSTICHLSDTLVNLGRHMFTEEPRSLWKTCIILGFTIADLYKRSWSMQTHSLDLFSEICVVGYCWN